jgi:hypothetical protein
MLPRTLPFVRSPSLAPISLLILVACVAVPASARSDSAQQLQHIPGTSVSLKPMPGFRPAPDFAGFVNASMGSILILEMPQQAYAQLEKIFGNLEAAKSNFAKNNIIVNTWEEIASADGGKAPLISATQNSGDVAYDKWLALVRGPPTVMVTVTSPHANRLDISAVRAMMESVSVGGKAPLSDQLAALPFTAAVSPPFRIFGSAMGAVLGMTVGEKDVDPERTQPMLLISYEPQAVDDPAEIEIRPRPIKSLGQAEIESKTRVAFAGLSGILLNGRCEGHRRFLQYMAVTSEHRLIVMAFVAPDSEFDGLKSAVETIAGSVSLRHN